MILGRLKIRTRIYAGFGSLIGLSLLVAASGSWGIDGLGRQTVNMTGLFNNIRNVAAALQGQETIARLLLRASFEPDDALRERFQQTQASVRDALVQAKTSTASAERVKIYESVLSKLDVQVFFANQTFDVGRKMLTGRTRLLAGGEVLSAASAKLAHAAAGTGSQELAAAAATSQRAILLARVANWRFLATKETGGPATFQTNVDRAVAALDSFQRIDDAGLSVPIKAVRDALAEYGSAFTVTAPSLLELAHLYETVERPLINGMQEELTKADLSLAADTAAAGTLSASVRDSTTLVQMIVGGLALVGGLVLAFFIGRGIARPISQMTTAMVTLAAGNHDVTIPGADSNDEIGDMARAVDVFKNSMIESNRLAIAQEGARAARSRRQDSMDQSTQAFGSSVTNVMAALSSAAINTRRAADIMAESAAAVRHQAAETAGDAGQSSADLTAVAAAVEEFTASVGEIARQVAVASDVASQAVQRAEASQLTIRGLADSTSRIGDVVRLIDSIAGQTNLLALNATIEAARAGDAGKGFAVVAGEVKALAAQTAKATAEIGAQIETVRIATEDTVTAMNEIGGIISKMGEVSTAISAAVEEQSVTTREIASSIQVVAGSTARAAGAMENVVQVADRAGDASRNILSDATEIGAEAEKLQREVEQFLSAVLKDSSERRRFERISGSGATATLRLAGAAAVKLPIQDLSKSGVALRFTGTAAAGTEAEIELPGAGGVVSGKVTRAGDGVIGIAFNPGSAATNRIERALADLSGISNAA